MIRIWNILGFICATTVTVFVCNSVAYFFYPVQYGRAWANYDIIRNQYEVRYLGLTFMNDLYHIYFKQHGIKYKRVAWCIVNTPIIESTKAYNQTMRGAILRDKGIDIDVVFEVGKLLTSPENDH